MNIAWYGQTISLTGAEVIGFGIIAVLIGLVIVVLKGYSLWYAARRGEVIWFIALLILNTIGILELIYLIFVAKRWSKDALMAEPHVPAPKI